MVFDKSDWHYKTQPKDFESHLESFRTLKDTVGITSADVDQLQAYIQTWYKSVSFPDNFSRFYQYCSAVKWVHSRSGGGWNLDSCYNTRKLPDWLATRKWNRQVSAP